MSIYIKGMNFPPEGCRVIIAVDGDGVVYRMRINGDYIFEQSDKREAIEIPPHGRLVDADAMAAKDDADYEDAMECIADVSSRSIVCQLHYGVRKMIEEADTVIPADREEPCLQPQR